MTFREKQLKFRYQQLRDMEELYKEVDEVEITTPTVENHQKCTELREQIQKCVDDIINSILNF